VDAAARLIRFLQPPTDDSQLTMPAYLIAEHIITDPQKFDEYRTKALPMIAKYGGRYLTKGGSHKLPEGGHWKPERVVIIEFPDKARLDAWYASPEYQPLIALRKECTSDLDMLISSRVSRECDSAEGCHARSWYRHSVARGRSS
jgi:uncharacterized protein (DUF1330 family)